MTEYIPTIIALIAGVALHIFKKAATRRQENRNFVLKDYLMDYPYQTISMFGAAGGAYLALVSAGSLTLSAAFLAGVAANSLSDAAPGSR